MSVPVPIPANPYEAQAREKKCRALALHMLTELVRVAETAEEATWNATARRAGVGVPSADSRTRVVGILKDVAWTFEHGGKL